MDPEDFETDGHHPIDEGRFFEIGDSVETGRDPVTAFEHVAGNLCLHCVDIIHQRRRTENRRNVDQRSEENNDQLIVAVCRASEAVATATAVV